MKKKIIQIKKKKWRRREKDFIYLFIDLANKRGGVEIKIFKKMSGLNKGEKIDTSPHQKLFIFMKITFGSIY